MRDFAATPERELIILVVPPLPGDSDRGKQCLFDLHCSGKNRAWGQNEKQTEHEVYRELIQPQSQCLFQNEKCEEVTPAGFFFWFLISRSEVI